MMLTDSPIAIPGIVLMLVLCGCNSHLSSHATEGNAIDHEVLDVTLNRNGFVETDEFRRICLSGAHMPERAEALAVAGDWKAASEQQLETAGLAGLKKKVLSIPGGGGRFEEEQVILAREVSGSLIALNLERRIAHGQTRSSLCAVYSRQEFLKTCERLGRMIGKSPDRNQVYPRREAHFIEWNSVIDGKETIVSCSRTPQSAILPYDGTILSVRIDHTGTKRKSAFNQLPSMPRSNRPVSGVSGR